MKPPPLYFDLSQPGQKDAMRKEAIRQIQALPDKGVFSVEVSRRRLSKTDAQLGYYWGHIIAIVMEWTGYTKEEAHRELGEACDWEEYYDPIGKQFKVRARALREGDRIDMMQRIDKARDYLLAEHGIVTQEPDPAWREKSAQALDNCGESA